MSILLFIVFWLVCAVMSYVLGRVVFYTADVMWTKSDRSIMLSASLLIAPITFLALAFLIFIFGIGALSCLVFGKGDEKARW